MPCRDERVGRRFADQGDLMDTTDFHSPSASRERAPVPKPDEDPQRIGRYRVLERLGQGGYGRVYLALDEELDREVAVKVPRADRVTGPDDIEEYLTEARSLARLDHPHIVPVYDVGRTDDGLCYVVSKRIVGLDLAARLRKATPSYRESAEIVANVADALHHAHTRGLVHRDVKPANILIDDTNRPCLTDFGLALKDEDFGKGATRAGTPSYMSPEQARAEGHRVDGRSDIFSLGAVLYELLTGRKPFRGDTYLEVIDQILNTEPRPCRQVEDSVPKELERICLKALAKRVTDRYPTARDMAEDLRVFLEGASGQESRRAPSASGDLRDVTPVTHQAPATYTGDDSFRVVPKGLRSFDEHDADFFLQLLPGARDRDGLPESVRFWKTRVESRDPERTFRVGMLYGPSGCGKSSLIRAGLIPRLGASIRALYVEATPAETEDRLLRGLRQVVPEVQGESDLVATLATLRRGRVLPSGQKVLIVIDQLEQWLVSGLATENTDLVLALRQCDGRHVQAILLVRDDFWLAASRFLRDLEVPLLEGVNSALVDLFDTRHATRVLTAFGQANGNLPARGGEITAEQRAFLDRAIQDLAQEGRIIPVRLALFAEMMKGKPWTPATLRATGGIQGVGLTFLEETFSAPSAPVSHRLHEKAARAILKLLLPPSGRDIKGQMRSEQELREATGYGTRTRDFEDVLRLLDNELRLITPTDPEGSAGAPNLATGRGERYYQLSHDYLVHSLREWLTRHQRQNRRGRAELRLTERATLWGDKPENRRLPTLVEWVGIHLLTQRREWTDVQRRMMRGADRFHGVRALLAILLAAAALWGGVEVHGRMRASALVDALQTASTADVPPIIRQLAPYQHWAKSRLTELAAQASPEGRAKLHASLALLPLDSTLVHTLTEHMVTAGPAEFPVLRDALRTHAAEIVPRLWPVLEEAPVDDPRVLPLAGALASYAPEDPRWVTVGDHVAEALVKVNPVFLGPWLEAVRPAQAALVGPLSTIFRDPRRPETEHTLATNVLAEFAVESPDMIADLLMDSDPKAFVRFFTLAERLAASVAPRLQAEVARQVVASWEDPPLDASSAKPASAIAQRFDSAEGVLEERFAYCQTLPFTEFAKLCEALRPAGYRPTRFRPYSDDGALRVAAVWTRDHRPWRFAEDLTAEEVRSQDESNRQARFSAVDVAGYLSGSGPRFAVVWVGERNEEERAEVQAGLVPDEWAIAESRMTEKDRKVLGRQVLRTPEGGLLVSGVWAPTQAGADAAEGPGAYDQFEPTLERDLLCRNDQLLMDASVYEGGNALDPTERAKAALARADARLSLGGEMAGAHLERGVALVALGDWEKAVKALEGPFPKGAKADQALRLQTIAMARLKRVDEARAGLGRYLSGDPSTRDRTAFAATVAAALGEGEEEAFKALESALAEQGEDLEWSLLAAGAYAQGARFARDDHLAAARRDRAIALVAQAAGGGEVDFNRLERDFDLDPLRLDPRWPDVVQPSRPDRRYATVWSADPRFESLALYGLDPATARRRGRDLTARGYRPIAASVARTKTGAPLLALSVWHRPLVQESAREELGQRQARAAAGLLRLGRAEAVWPLLRHSPDPRVRSFLINWLKELGANAHPLIAEFDRLDKGPQPALAPGVSPHQAVVFHPETSTRRALVLALGSFPIESLDAGDAARLTQRFLELHRDDPDAGIHGATAWALRSWGKGTELQAASAGPVPLESRGPRRWFRDAQGRDHAILEGPIEFLVGSPQTEPDHDSTTETLRTCIIPRRFAVSLNEVTKAEFQRFSQKSPRYAPDPANLARFSPDADGPMVFVTWYAAAAYCNWLSEREGLPREQWCYVPLSGDVYDEGMTIPADFLQRAGYRLPTEAEWECAHRAGAVTTRDYGFSPELLVAYGWSQGNSRDRAWSVGRKKPNDLGLFDTMGNTLEWCHDPFIAVRGDRAGVVRDEAHHEETIAERTSRALRGGSFYFPPSLVRAANRGGYAPSQVDSYIGFRTARTCP